MGWGRASGAPMINKIANIFRFNGTTQTSKIAVRDRSSSGRQESDLEQKKKREEALKKRLTKEDIDKMIEFLNQHLSYQGQITFARSSEEEFGFLVTDRQGQVVQKIDLHHLVDLFNRLSSDRENNTKGGLLNISC